jgi:hypothetical protein
LNVTRRFCCRFPNSKKPEEAEGKNLVSQNSEEVTSDSPTSMRSSSRIIHDSTKIEPQKVKVSPAPSLLLPTSQQVKSNITPLFLYLEL